MSIVGLPGQVIALSFCTAIALLIGGCQLPAASVAVDAPVETDATVAPEPAAAETNAEIEPGEPGQPAAPEASPPLAELPAPVEPLSASALDDLCDEIGNKLASVAIAECKRQNLVATDGRSVLGRPIAMREYPPLPNREPLGRVLLIGGIHGDEYSSVSIVFKWMEILNEHHSGLFHWHVIPLMNPDGLLRAQSQRQNENGVDLNRNFPSADWDDLAIPYWRERAASNERRYPGPEAASEPEIAWLVEHIKAFKPDIIISMHAPYHLVDYDGPPQAPEQLGDLQLNKLGVYPGSLGNYAGLDLDRRVLTVELPYAGIMPGSTMINRMWTDIVGWLTRELSADRSREPMP